MTETDALLPLAGRDGDPVFDEAWQAQALAIADTLVQNGLFSASVWSQALGAALAAAERDGEADDQDTYYRCVLRAVETLIEDNSDIDRAAMRRQREEWEQAYRQTPHGEPVLLERDRNREG